MSALVLVVLGRIVAVHHATPLARTDQSDQSGPTSHVGGTGGTATPRVPVSPGSGDGARPSGRPGATPAAGSDAFFTPTRLKPGEKPPQFIIVSFDGSGSHTLWRFWQQVADRAGMRFTGFLSGVYLLDHAHATEYQGPGHQAGASDVDFSADGTAIATLINDLNDAWRRGDEIGTHFNGHFCAGSGYSGGQWSQADWDNELDQFFDFLTHYKRLNGLTNVPDLAVPADSIKGERTPCLEDQQSELFAALRDHQMTFDSSGNTNGIAWPKKIDGVWEFPLAEVPVAGSTKGTLSMDYNFFYWQHEAHDADPATAKKDSQQVLATYQHMFDATYHGNRAPLVLGNHFNEWNHGAYTQALATFVESACHQPQVRCVPYRDVIRWMDAQDPTVLARLQALPSVDQAHP